MPAPTNTSEDSNIVFNKSLLSCSAGAGHVQSWLSSSLKAQNGITSVEDEEQEEPEIDGDEEEGGLGLVAPVQTLTQDRHSLSANEKLRKQLMGNRPSTLKTNGGSGIQHQVGLSASKPKPRVSKATISDIDDEADGRTSTAGKSSKTLSKPIAISPSHDRPQEVSSKPNAKKRSTNYLDELLAQRQSKKAKNQKNAQMKPT